MIKLPQTWAFISILSLPEQNSFVW